MRPGIVRFVALVAFAAAPVVVEAQPGPPAGPRAQLEQRVRAEMARVVQQRVGLSDEQMRKLGEVNRRFEARRRLLVDQERDARMALREQLLAEERADQAKVSQYLDVLLRVQRQRLDVLEQEQREIAAFMTPVQRAKFLVVQDQVRRRVEEMRRQQLDRQGAPPGGRPRSGRRGPPGGPPGF